MAKFRDFEGLRPEDMLGTNVTHNGKVVGYISAYDHETGKFDTKITDKEYAKSLTEPVITVKNISFSVEYKEQEIDPEVIPIPQPIQWDPANGDQFAEVREAAKKYIDYLSSDEYHEDVTDDYEHPILESAIIALYGPKIYGDYINKKLK